MFICNMLSNMSLHYEMRCYVMITFIYTACHIPLKVLYVACVLVRVTCCIFKRCYTAWNAIDTFPTTLGLSMEILHSCLPHFRHLERT